MSHRKISQILTFCLVAMAPQIFGQGQQQPQSKSQEQNQSQIDEDSNTQTQKKQKKKRRKKKKRPHEPSKYLPDWPTSRFGWGIKPIVGFQQSETVISGAKTTTTISEAGGGFVVRGLPLIPGNVGIDISPRGSYTNGQHKSIRKKQDSEKKYESAFTRTTIGASTNIYLKSYRHVFGLDLGSLEYKKDFTTSKEISILNDFGLLIIDFFSMHLTTTVVTVYESKISNPLLEEKDYWIHGRFHFSSIGLVLDLGPGFTMLETFEEQDDKRIVNESVSTAYILGKFAVNIVWKLGISGTFKYVYGASETKVQSTGDTVLPTKEVSDSDKIATLPRDTLTSTIFFGARRIYGGIGVGWQISQTIYNFQETDGDAVSLKEQGLLITYDLAI